jgi:hypothetical protein
MLRVPMPIARNSAVLTFEFIDFACQKFAQYCELPSVDRCGNIFPGILLGGNDVLADNACLASCDNATLI